MASIGEMVEIIGGSTHYIGQKGFVTKVNGCPPCVTVKLDGSGSLVTFNTQDIKRIDRCRRVVAQKAG